MTKLDSVKSGKSNNGSKRMVKVCQVRSPDEGTGYFFKFLTQRLYQSLTEEMRKRVLCPLFI